MSRLVILALTFGAVCSYGQDEIVLRPDLPAGEEWYAPPADNRFVQRSDEKWVRKVQSPVLEAYPAEHPNGTAVIVAPGGGFSILAINHEGRDVAHWLNERGVTAFVLRYRVGLEREESRAAAVEDGLTAIRTVRERAAQWSVDPHKIGILGFSAGGYAVVGAATEYKAESRPDFAVPVYPATPQEFQAPADAPPLFIAVAYDDRPGMVMSSTKLMDVWRAAERPAELHVFSDGGHGFGMIQFGTASDQWTALLESWMTRQGLL